MRRARGPGGGPRRPGEAPSTGGGGTPPGGPHPESESPAGPEEERDPAGALFEIPADRLPEGFARAIDAPPETPAEARPAATITLIREAARGPEVLLLRRRRETAFVPGAYVFPGGRVDAGDADPALLDLVFGAPAAWEPAAAYWLAAVREAFEETGVLLARTGGGAPVPDAGASPAVAEWRESLLEDRCGLLEALLALDARADLEQVVHNAHWVTPVAEPRRYDTRFFLARTPHGARVREDPREMTEAVWLRPEDAVRRFRDGALPMVFPTVRTLESLVGFDSVAAALDHFRGREVPRIQPRLVRTRGGVAIRVDQPGAAAPPPDAADARSRSDSRNTRGP